MNEYAFSDLTVGMTDCVEVRIEPEQIDRFAEYSGDFSTIHMHDEYALSRGFKARIGHGLMVGAFISAFIGMKLPGKHGLLQSISCEFRRPCYAPNVLTIAGTVVRRSEAMKIVALDIVVTDQSGAEIVRAQANSVLKL